MARCVGVASLLCLRVARLCELKRSCEGKLQNAQVLLHSAAFFPLHPASQHLIFPSFLKGNISTLMLLFLR